MLVEEVSQTRPIGHEAADHADLEHGHVALFVRQLVAHADGQPLGRASVVDGLGVEDGDGLGARRQVERLRARGPRLVVPQAALRAFTDVDKGPFYAADRWARSVAPSDRFDGMISRAPARTALVYFPRAASLPPGVTRPVHLICLSLANTAVSGDNVLGVECLL